MRQNLSGNLTMVIDGEHPDSPSLQRMVTTMVTRGTRNVTATCGTGFNAQGETTKRKLPHWFQECHIASNDFYFFGIWGYDYRNHSAICDPIHGRYSKRRYATSISPSKQINVDFTPSFNGLPFWNLVHTYISYLYNVYIPSCWPWLCVTTLRRTYPLAGHGYEIKAPSPTHIPLGTSWKKRTTVDYNSTIIQQLMFNYHASLHHGIPKQYPQTIRFIDVYRISSWYP